MASLLPLTIFAPVPIIKCSYALVELLLLVLYNYIYMPPTPSVCLSFKFDLNGTCQANEYNEHSCAAGP